MSRPHSDKKLTRLISKAAGTVALVAGLSLPALHLLINYQHELAEVETLSRIHGSLVTSAINKNPVMWRFEEHKLQGMVEDRAPDRQHATVHRILDTDRQPLASSAGEALAWPRITSEMVLYDATRPVGYYRVERSLRDLLHENLLFAAGGLLLALLIVFPLRSLPLRALRQSQERLEHMAHHDVLTGLPNRALLEDRLNQAIFYAQRYERFVSLVFIDLDNFKTINDSLGHDVGDELLRQTAQRMTQAVRRTDTVVRMGGDEFVIVLFDQPEKAETITGTIERIREQVATPMSIGRHTLRVTCSMGLATYPHDGRDSHTLLKNADAAMYRAKELGRNNFQFYTAEMNSKLKERVSLQQGLLRALENEEFGLVYQPQILARTGQTVGVEALIRWQHPEFGLVPPARFIPLAEETGLIVPIGEWVLRTACRQNKAWQQQGLPPVKVSVNVSPRQFKEKSWTATVAQVLAETGLDPKYLELEITESLIMEDVERAIEIMNTLQEMGVQLSIDDFGTGYSSLSSLKHFPVARLKIDQSFVRSLPDSEDDCSIAMAVIALGHRLKLKVVAEGVETEQQRVFLHDNECDEMQGYHFSRPVSAQEIEQQFLAAPLAPLSDAA
ncbi:putative bifunctional diguanylate cyclase/phosphodiesterase [Caldimonas tepidiphila]|uniref:putative bifunctional diguanylate cyclase/phosphodiesterase n=1 Tax=Caldimonas tepidiphila TaxID=2315841 RepID=UPI000E5C4337|nr:EAL domain-containing protein [Caldimonas tepidiphila]